MICECFSIFVFRFWEVYLGDIRKIEFEMESLDGIIMLEYSII